MVLMYGMYFPVCPNAAAVASFWGVCGGYWSCCGSMHCAAPLGYSDTVLVVCSDTVSVVIDVRTLYS